MVAGPRHGRAVEHVVLDNLDALGGQDAVDAVRRPRCGERRPALRVEVCQPAESERVPRGSGRPLVEVAGSQPMRRGVTVEHLLDPAGVLVARTGDERQVDAGHGQARTRLGDDRARDAAVGPAVLPREGLRAGLVHVDAQMHEKGRPSGVATAGDVQQTPFAGQGRALGAPPEVLGGLLHAHDVGVSGADDLGEGSAVVAQPAHVIGHDPQLDRHDDNASRRDPGYL